MPTAAKLVAAVFFAVLSWIVAKLYAQGLPQGTQTGQLGNVAALVGVICGWRVSGSLVGRGYGEAAGNGLRTAVTIGFWVLLIFSIYDMIVLSTKMRYDGPMEALLGTFVILLDYAKLLLKPAVLGTGLIGGMVGGIVTEIASKRWK